MNPVKIKSHTFQLHKDWYGFWFRLFGYGLSVVDRRRSPELFSTRNGYKKVLRFKHWTIRPLLKGKA